MGRGYFFQSRNQLLKRLECFRKEDYVKFFEDSDAFRLALSLAYFGLSEELLIERDNNNPNITTRFKKHIDDDSLSGLFSKPEQITVREREVLGTTPEWFLSTLRNGIYHMGPDVDYKNKVITVKNNGAMNKLDCDVTFDWFLDFMKDNVVDAQTLDTYKYTMFFNPNQKFVGDAKITTYDELRRFIDEDLVGFDIKFQVKDGGVESITQQAFINYCGKLKSTFFSYWFSDVDIDSETRSELDRIKRDVVIELGDAFGEYDVKTYNNLVCYGVFKKWFKEKFGESYPDYDVEVGMFNRNTPGYNLVVNGLDHITLERQLFPTVSKRNKFFNYTHGLLQKYEAESLLTKIINYDKKDYLSSIHYLARIYDYYSGIVTKDYGLAGYMSRMIHDRSGKNRHNIEDDYIQRIYNDLTKKGVQHTYDNQITDAVMSDAGRREGAIYQRCSELFQEFDRNEYLSSFEKLKETLKHEFPDFYETEYQARKGSMMSDQVADIYVESDLYVMLQAKDVFIEHRDEILTALLYTLGVNTFVVNKETAFVDYPIDYSFMDDPDISIVGYSKSKADEVAMKRNTRRNAADSLRGIDKVITGVSASLSKPMTVEERARREAVVRQKQIDKARVQGEYDLADTFVTNTPISRFGGVDMGLLTNEECATTIRNCFSHCGRIFIDGRDGYGETRLVLTDYDENGNLSGIVKTNLSSMIKFFGNKQFEQVFRQESVVVSSGEREVEILEMFEDVTTSGDAPKHK